MGTSTAAFDARGQIGSRLRAARTARGITLRRLAAELGVSPATLSAVENGRTSVSAVRLSQAAELLDVPVEHLLRAVPGSAAADWRSYGPLRLEPPLAAALAAFLELGYAGATMRDIGRRAGMSVPGLYHHHASKQRLLVALLELAMTDLLARSAAARAEGGNDPVARFRLLVECLALFHTCRRELGFIGASEMRSLEPAAHARIAAARTEQQRMVDDEVLLGCHDGAFSTPRPREAARAVVTMCTALPQWYSPHGPSTPDQIAASYVEIALDVVRWRSPSTATTRPAPRREVLR
ncbi:MAG: TetR family transcriptional regulator [Actinomycetota bacterium]|nr:TetR family transcriptional regulator [Actinomycetota bacterium]